METKKVRKGILPRKANILFFGGMRLAIICFILLLTGIGMASAAPVITDWSNNYTNDQDIMFLVNQSNTITFSVTVSESVTYNWSVNKIDQNNNQNSFTLTVPNEKGIWEIHLKASNANGEDHIEWVVSTLSADEAPDFFEYFADKKHESRTDTDPWGRPLYEWSGFDYLKDISRVVENGYYNPGNGKISTENGSPPAFGTWRFWVRFTHVHNGMGLGLTGDNGNTGAHNFASLGMSKSDGIHWYFGESGKWFPLLREKSVRGWHDLSKTILIKGPSWAGICDKNWHLVTITRSQDGWTRVWLDREQISCQAGYSSNLLKRVNKVGIKGWQEGTSPVAMDGYEFYNGVIIHPAQASNYIPYPCFNKTIAYREYIDIFEYDGYMHTNAVWDWGIVAEGDNIHLQEIAEAINNDSLFTYNSATKTADCYTNFVIRGGSELVLENETLRMHCSTDGEHRIRVKNGATIKLIDSTITSANEHYYLWAFTSAELGQPFMEHRDPDLTNNMDGGWSEGAHYLNFDGRFIMLNSTIENCGNIVLRGASEIIIRNSRFLDLVNASHGHFHSYDEKGWLKNFAKGEKALWILNQLPIENFEIRNVTFKGKDGNPPVSIGIIGGGKTVDEERLENVKLENAKLLVRRGILGRVDSAIQRMYDNPDVNLVNCKFNEAEIDLSRSYDVLPSGFHIVYPGSRSTYLTPSYYLDVKVVDSSGNPVQNATIRVENKEDDVRFPAETLDCTNQESVFIANIGPGPGDAPPQLAGYPWMEWWRKTVVKPEHIVEQLKSGEKEEKYIEKEIEEIFNEEYDGEGRLIHFQYYTKGDETQDDYMIYDINITYNEKGLVKNHTLVGTHYSDKNVYGRYWECPDKPGWYYMYYHNFLHEFNYTYDEEGNVLSYVETQKNYEEGYEDCIINQREVVSAVRTGADGHTPLPSDKKHSLVVADYKLDRDNPEWALNQTNFTYNITASKDGKIASMSGLDIDESWYRENLNEPTKTVVCNVDTGACYVEGVATGTISGTVTDRANPIEGATVSDGTRQDITNENGSYTIANVSAGTYTVTCTKEGYQDASQSDVVVQEGETTVVDFVLEDNVPPYTSGHSPSKNATNVSRDINIVVHIKDDGLGVNQSSIIMTVEGETVYNGSDEASYPLTERTGTEADYTFTYNPASDFSYEQVVDITIDARDLASPANVMPPDNYSFTTEEAPDTTPPASISNLQNTTGTTWINWTWNNPSDNDFNHTMVYLNGTWQTNTSNPYYNATDLTPDTNYEIGTLTVDTAGNVNSTLVNQTTKTLALNSAPVADPNGPYTGTEGIPITFDGSGSYDPDGSIVSYEWDFGAGNTSSEVSPTHTYAQNGNYTVTLTVTDDNAATDTNTTTATIADTEPLVTNPAATPATILNDPGRPRAPGTNISQLNVTVTDDTEVDTVTIDLSPIGGFAAAQMTKIPETDIWTVTTNAVEGINIAHNLIVTATDISGNFNNTVSISLTVLRRSDVFRDNIIDMKDAVYITRYLAGLEPERSNPPSVLVGDIVGSGGDPTGDGIVNMKDAVYIARYKAGWEDEP